MKTCPSHLQLRFAPYGILAAAALLGIPQSAKSASLTYDVAANPGWFANDAWTGDHTTWVSGDSATIDAPDSATTILVSESTNVTDLTLYGDARLTGTGTNTLTMSGGDLTVTNATGGSIIELGVTIQGDYTKKGGGWLRVNGTGRVLAYEGTATMEEGKVTYTSSNLHLGPSSHLVLAGATVELMGPDTTMGALTVNSGRLDLGRANRDENNFTLTVASLSGEGGAIHTIPRFDNRSLTLERTLIVDQTANTTFSGELAGVNEGARIILNKEGAGDLALAGQITLARETTVSGGRLYINSSNAVFSDDAGSTAINVHGGTLGGTGTLTVTGGDNVIVSATGKLAAGIEGAVGRSTYAFDTASALLDLSAATASSNTGWIKFELGAVTTPGTTYDQIMLSSGALKIGDGLNFSDFDFTALAGFGPGTYVLFQTPTSIDGTLGAATGTIGNFHAELKIAGSNLVLVVGSRTP